MIKEINETTASVVLEYQLTSQNDEEETELYDVKEILQNEMINAVSLRVPLNIDIEQGASWYEAK